MNHTNFLSFPVQWLLRWPGHLCAMVERGDTKGIMRRAWWVAHLIRSVFFVTMTSIFGVITYVAMIIHPGLFFIITPACVWLGAVATRKFHQLMGTGPTPKSMLDWLAGLGVRCDPLPKFHLQAEIAWLILDDYGKSLMHSNNMLYHTAGADNAITPASNRF